MWHWNSLWARAPGDPPTIDDPRLWTTPWTPEQALALQTRSWEAMLSTSHSWWTMLMAAWPMVPSWPLPPWAATPATPSADTDTAIEPVADDAPAPRKAAARRPAVRKLPATKRHTGTAARKH